MALNAAAAQAAFMAAGRSIEAGRLPLWTGSSDTTFTAEQWVSRIQKAATAAGWNDRTIMSNVFNALRGDALIWFEHYQQLDMTMKIGRTSSGPSCVPTEQFERFAQPL
jgi:hypothetical protein